MNSCQVMKSRAAEIMKREKRPENSALNLDCSSWKFHYASWRGRSVASMETHAGVGESRVPIVFSLLSLWRPSQKGLISRGTIIPLGSSCSCCSHQRHPASTRLAWAEQRCELDAHLNSPPNEWVQVSKLTWTHTLRTMALSLLLVTSNTVLILVYDKFIPWNYKEKFLLGTSAGEMRNENKTWSHLPQIPKNYACFRKQN